MMKYTEHLLRLYRRFPGRFNAGALLLNETAGAGRILDVGCGRRSALRGLGGPHWKAGVDHYHPYLVCSRKQRMHQAYVRADVLSLPFRTGAFDVAVATEVLEHLEKSGGRRMIGEMARVARRKIVLTTPNGFVATHAGPEDNPDETHLSGWSVAELREMGFTVYGINGPKCFWTVRDGRSQMRLVPDRFRLIRKPVSDLTGLFVYRHPEVAFQLFCVRETA